MQVAALPVPHEPTNFGACSHAKAVIMLQANAVLINIALFIGSNFLLLFLSLIVLPFFCYVLFLLRSALMAHKTKGEIIAATKPYLIKLDLERGCSVAASV